MNDPAYQARREQCKQLARERGDTHKTGTGAGKMRDPRRTEKKNPKPGSSRRAVARSRSEPNR